LESEPKFFSTDNETGIVLLRLKNVNPNYGADNFVYVLKFYDVAGNQIYELSGKSYIYAGQIKILVEAPIKVEVDKVSKINVEIKDVQWKSIDQFSRPITSARSVKTELIKNHAKVTGLAFNNNSFPLAEVTVGVVAYSDLGFEISASKTLLKDLRPFEERAFTIFVPLADQRIDTKATEVIVDGLR